MGGGVVASPPSFSRGDGETRPGAVDHARELSEIESACAGGWASCGVRTIRDRVGQKTAFLLGQLHAERVKAITKVHVAHLKGFEGGKSGFENGQV